MWSDLSQHVGETVAALQGGGGGGQEDLSSDLTSVHFVCVWLGVHYKDTTKKDRFASLSLHSFTAFNKKCTDNCSSLDAF